MHVYCTFILAHFQQGIEEECCLLVQIFNLSCCEVEERALMLVEIHRKILHHYARVCPAWSEEVFLRYSRFQHHRWNIHNLKNNNNQDCMKAEHLLC